jgi:hypothetical protein
MRLHTNTHTMTTIEDALRRAKGKGKVAYHVGLFVLTPHRSQSRTHAFELRLGTEVKIKGDKRTFLNSGTRGADTSIYAATYDEWGWFLAEVFAADPDAACDRYTGERNFHEVTRHAYHLTPDVITGYPHAKTTTP